MRVNGNKLNFNTINTQEGTERKMSTKGKSASSPMDQRTKTTIRIRSGTYKALQKIMNEEGHTTVTSLIDIIIDERVRLIPEAAKIISASELRINNKMEGITIQIESLTGAIDQIAKAINNVFSQINFEDEDEDGDGEETVINETTERDGTPITIDQHGEIIADKNRGWKKAR